MPLFTTRAEVYVTSFSGCTKLSVGQNWSQLFGKLSPFVQLNIDIERATWPQLPLFPFQQRLSSSLLISRVSSGKPLKVVELFYLVVVG